MSNSDAFNQANLLSLCEHIFQKGNDKMVGLLLKLLIVKYNSSIDNLIQVPETLLKLVMSYIHRSLVEEKIERAIFYIECARNLTNFKNKAGVKENSIILTDFLVELWNFKKSPMKTLMDTQLPYFLQ